MVDLEELRRLNEARTQGEWSFDDPQEHGVPGEYRVHWYDVDADDDGRAVDHGYTICTVHDASPDEGAADAAFIAAIANAIPALLEEISSGKEREAKLREALGLAVAFIDNLRNAGDPEKGVRLTETGERALAAIRTALGSAP